MYKEKLSKTKELASIVLFAALQIVQERNGESPKHILIEIENRVQLNDWAKATYEKSGYVRWRSILQFYSIYCIKAGYLIKNNGVWYITTEGESALLLGEVGLLKSVVESYNKWLTTREKTRIRNR